MSAVIAMSVGVVVVLIWIATVIAAWQMGYVKGRRDYQPVVNHFMASGKYNPIPGVGAADRRTMEDPTDYYKIDR